MKGVSKVAIPVGFAVVGWMLREAVFVAFGPLVLALVCFTVLVGYMVGAGYTGQRWLTNHRAHCPRVRDHGVINCTVEHEIHLPTALVAIFWPFILPIMVGVRVATRSPRVTGTAAEIARLEHELGMGNG